MAVVIATLSALVTTAPAPAAELKGFTADTSINYWGYYQPVKPVVFGTWRLDTIQISPPDDFKNFSTGKRPPGVTADTDLTPFTIGFEGTVTPKGGMAPTASVHPTAYRVTGNSVSFVGETKETGIVTFEGTFSPAFFKNIAAHHDAKNTTTAVMIGTLTVAGKSMPVSLSYFDGGAD